MSGFESYSIKDASDARKGSVDQGPQDLPIRTSTVGSISTLDSLNNDRYLDEISFKGLNIDIKAEAEAETEGDEYEDDDLSFELYEEGLDRSRLINQLKNFNINGDSNEMSEFLLGNYKYWSLDDLSSSLGNLLGELDRELMKLVNTNYLHYINLDKSIDGSLDLTNDIKIDLNTYLKALKNENKNIDLDVSYVNKMKNEKSRLIYLKYNCESIIKLSELIECFDALIKKFDLSKSDSENLNLNESIHGSRTHMLLELTGLYFAITRIFVNLISISKRYMNNGLSLDSSKIMTSLGRKMNGLKLEFSGLLNNYVKELKDKMGEGTDKGKGEEGLKAELFEVFKVYQLLNSSSEFKNVISSV